MPTPSTTPPASAPASAPVLTVSADGTREWRRHGELHRDDGPAVEQADGTRWWYRHGKRHRDDGPAIEQANGTRHWCRHGKRHRDDGPAIEWADDTREWWRNGFRAPRLLEHLLNAGLPLTSAVTGEDWVPDEVGAIEAVVAALPLATRRSVLLRALAHPASQGGVAATPDWSERLLRWLGRPADATATPVPPPTTPRIPRAGGA